MKWKFNEIKTKQKLTNKYLKKCTNAPLFMNSLKSSKKNNKAYRFWQLLKDHNKI